METFFLSEQKMETLLRKLETLPASAIMGMFGAEAQTDLAVAAISGGLKRQKKTNKTTAYKQNKKV